MAAGPKAWTQPPSRTSDAFLIPERDRRVDAPSPGGGVFARSAGGKAVRQADILIADLRRDLIGYLQRRDRSGDVEDLVQETFVRFHRAGHDLTASDARPLLFVIARNLQLDGWKSTGREKARRTTDDIHDLDAGPRAIAGEEPTADQRLISQQNLAAAAAVIRGLSPKTRDAFLLHRFESLTYRQIAARLGVSVSMVEKYIAEALRQLKAGRDD
ncbi:MAG: RNA polymerase subunit sigma-24 [Caulobacter sp. 12-67-6]|nr:MAG: RNA polymerase subunit sigma-24 [Caulobacter sp. 12-67-6]OYX70744.1 MAG: RNA polymerase subunit sigma-24 [Caulobacter sp. 32-67-35]